MAHEVTFLVAVRVAQVEPDLINTIDMAHWIDGRLQGTDARVVDVTVWDSLADLKADEAEGKLEPWVTAKPDDADPCPRCGGGHDRIDEREPCPERLPFCPPDCTNDSLGACPRCFEETRMGCGHGPLCDVHAEEAETPTPHEWKGHQDPDHPDTCWIDDDTGEHVDAKTARRTPTHPQE